MCLTEINTSQPSGAEEAANAAKRQHKIPKSVITWVLKLGQLCTQKKADSNRGTERLHLFLDNSCKD